MNKPTRIARRTRRTRRTSKTESEPRTTGSFSGELGAQTQVRTCGSARVSVTLTDGARPRRLGLPTVARHEAVHARLGGGGALGNALGFLAAMARSVFGALKRIGGK